MFIKLYSENVPIPATVIIKDFNGATIKKPTEEDILYTKIYTMVRSQQEQDAINELKGIDLLKLHMSVGILKAYDGLVKNYIDDSFVLKLKEVFEILMANTGSSTIDLAEALITYANLEKYFWKWKLILNRGNSE
ncbi:MAG: hypothetical protein ACTSXD_03290 [Candidatus Heimdallarchaeaceae archaeon]